MFGDTWTHKYVAMRSAPSLAREYGRKHVNIRVTAGLHKMGGNQRPYFSVTADLYAPAHPHSPFSCGCQHDHVLKYFPKLAPVVALHLCDDTGAPMHAVSDAWYNLAGYYGGANAPYHIAQTRIQVKEGDRYILRTPTPLECLERFARMVRADIATVQPLADAWRAQWRPDALYYPVGPDMTDWPAVQVSMEAWIEEQRARWQSEADQAIALLDELITAKA